MAFDAAFDLRRVLQIQEETRQGDSQDNARAGPGGEAAAAWTLHGLRRTARSLMSRVPSGHAERCLDRVTPGIRGTCDRHEYHREKQLAYEALAAQVPRIIDPQRNVIPMRLHDTARIEMSEHEVRG
jgi:hypothetical protein